MHSAHIPKTATRPYYPTLADHFYNYCPVGQPDDCWEWQGGKNEKGYGRIYHRHESRFAHRVAWELVNGPIPDGLHVLHQCDNPSCCNPAHLFLGTNADNVADRERKGRRAAPQGQANGRAKLSDRDVREIRKLRRQGASQPVLARKFGVTQSTISCIVLFRGWTHVGEDNNSEHSV